MTIVLILKVLLKRIYIFIHSFIQMPTVHWTCTSIRIPFDVGLMGFKNRLEVGLLDPFKNWATFSSTFLATLVKRLRNAGVELTTMWKDVPILFAIGFLFRRYFSLRHLQPKNQYFRILSSKIIIIIIYCIKILKY